MGLTAAVKRTHGHLYAHLSSIHNILLQRQETMGWREKKSESVLCTFPASLYDALMVKQARTLEKAVERVRGCLDELQEAMHEFEKLHGDALKHVDYALYGSQKTDKDKEKDKEGKKKKKKPQKGKALGTPSAKSSNASQTLTPTQQLLATITITPAQSHQFIATLMNACKAVYLDGLLRYGALEKAMVDDEALKQWTLDWMAQPGIQDEGVLEEVEERLKVMKRYGEAIKKGTIG